MTAPRTITPPRNILLVAMGSSGDVHPFVGLGSQLAKRGHRVTIVTNPTFRELIEQTGLGFIPLGDKADMQRTIENPDLWHPRRGFHLVMRGLILPLTRPLYEIICDGYLGSDALVVGPATAFGARAAQIKHGVPLATVHLQPVMLRSVYDSPRLPMMNLSPRVPRWLKRLQYWAVDRYLEHFIEGDLHRLLADIGLPAPDRVMHEWWNSPQLILCLFPEWFAPRQPDWPYHLVSTGFPLWDESSTTPAPPSGLAEFMAAGTPPIVFTPGSANMHAKGFFQAGLEATLLLGRRAIFLSRFRDHLPRDLPASIAHFEYVPLGKLLPACAAIVHHGGIGTCGQGLAAGIPQLAMPMGYDQPDNAERLRRLGVGLGLPPKKFRGPAVAKALDKLIRSPEVAARARQLAARLDTAAALEQSCGLIENLTSPYVGPPREELPAAR